MEINKLAEKKQDLKKASWSKAVGKPWNGDGTELQSNYTEKSVHCIFYSVGKNTLQAGVHFCKHGPAKHRTGPADLFNIKWARASSSSCFGGLIVFLEKYLWIVVAPVLLQLSLCFLGHNVPRLRLTKANNLLPFSQAAKPLRTYSTRGVFLFVF